MPLPKFCSPFPRLSLNEDDKAELRRLTKSMVADVVDEYETYLWKKQGMLNPRHWSLVREKDDVRVYQDRRKPLASAAPKMQELLTVGTLLGELDDALYGVLSPTTESMRLLAAYTKDRVSNCAVLATLKSPTHAKPFRSMTIKWLVSRLPLHLRALSKKRDMVVVECTGTRTLSNGETVGFQFIHSIEVSQAPPLPNYVRVDMSSCSIWRQKSEDRVQIFAKAYVQTQDKLLAATTLRSTSEGLVALARSMQCSQMKKLAWLMRTRQASAVGSRTKNSSITSASDLSSRSSSSTERGCEICPSQTSRRGAKSVCTICSRLVCSACRVKRELCTIAPDRRLLEQRVAFCVPCHTIAIRAAAADVASEEAAQLEAGRVSPAHITLGVAGLVYMAGKKANRKVGSYGDSDDDSDGYGYGYGYDHSYGNRKSLPSAASMLRVTMDDDELDASPVARARSASELTTVILGDECNYS